MTIARGLLVLLIATPLPAKAPAQLKVAPNAASKSVNVDCTKGESIQAALDKNGGPVVISIHGVCIENVLVRQHEVTLSGTDPATDGIQGTASGPALVIRSSDNTVVENLSISNSAAGGVLTSLSRVTMDNCRVLNNHGRGIDASFAAIVVASNMTISFNQGPGIVARNSAEIFCIACRAEGNIGFAGLATNAGLLSYLRSEVIGTRGILASGGGAYADIDCVSDPSPHPCSMQATAVAAYGSGGTAFLFESGDFTGSVLADSGGTAGLLGARQQSASNNNIDGLSNLTVDSGDTGDSRLAGHTVLNAFSRALIRSTSTLAGSLQCNSASDAWIDPTVTRAPGSSVTGCAHVP